MEEYLVNNIPLTWDYKKWIEEFKKASKTKMAFRVSRKKVFDHTVEIVKAGEYNVDNVIYALNRFADVPKTYNDSVFYPNTESLSLPRFQQQSSTMYAIQADCIEVGHMMKALGFHPIILNMANASTPGGAVKRGAGAQEENLFRRSNLYTSLYQYIDFGLQYGIRPHPQLRYPIPTQSGGVYSPEVLFFRSSEHTGYALLTHPSTLSVVTVPAIAFPKLSAKNGKNWLIDDAVALTKNKIRTILRISANHQHNCLVLSAFGCGAFRNPPHHMARLFKEVLTEDDFNGRFKAIIFAIVDDHNAWKPHNPVGNLIPFQEVFNS